MKPVIYYAIVNFNYYSYQIMAVTSEKNHHIFGRFTRNNETTHTTKDKIKAKFNTETKANDMLAQVKAICEIANGEIKILNQKMNEIHRKENSDIAALLDDS